ncbi:hypothetical protein [Virgibacillus halodenitrificans]|uniref:hypothetical protein n=1 Tax=Virgibacillus halodenitrificans TaxID=1482 RepID=UPI000EF5491C|nr:hypothetical protein [Virgibacillus halodenitrificans]
MDKWLNNKRLNIIQVSIYWVILIVYLLAIKIKWFNNISFIVLIIGAVLSVMIILIRFIFPDKVDGKIQK